MLKLIKKKVGTPPPVDREAIFVMVDKFDIANMQKACVNPAVFADLIKRYGDPRAARPITPAISRWRAMTTHGVWVNAWVWIRNEDVPKFTALEEDNGAA
jgi:hypothetical protein